MSRINSPTLARPARRLSLRAFVSARPCGPQTRLLTPRNAGEGNGKALKLFESHIYKAATA